MEKTGILVVSFGTSVAATRKKTLDAIENDIRREFAPLPVYSAWTSGMIRKKVAREEGLEILSVSEAIEAMKEAGITEILVQPTHILKGIEFEKIVADLNAAKGIEYTLAEPLISGEKDLDSLLNIMQEVYRPESSELLLLMGHGSDHRANELYARMNKRAEQLGLDRILTATVEGTPSLADMLPEIARKDPKKVILAPFLIVAGVHALEDMSSDSEDSWKSILEREDYDVECRLTGLGEFPQIRRKLAEHAKTALKNNL